MPFILNDCRGICYTENYLPVQISLGGEYGSGTATATQSGTELIFEHTFQLPAEELVLYGQSVQNTPPTPETPAEITSLGQSGGVSLLMQGKNLFNKSNYSLLSNYPDEAPVSGYRRAGIQLEPNTTYNISVQRLNGWKGTEGGYLMISNSPQVNANYTSVASVGFPDVNRSPYVTGNDGLLYIGYAGMNQTQLTAHLKNTRIQIEKSGAATEYHIYRAAVLRNIPITLSGLPDGTADRFHAATGELHRSTVMKSLNSLSWRTGTTGTDYVQFVSTNSAGTGLEIAGGSPVLCTHFIQVPNTTSAEGNYIRWDSTNTVLIVQMSKRLFDGWSDQMPETEKVSAFTAWLTGHAVKVLSKRIASAVETYPVEELTVIPEYCRITAGGAHLSATVQIADLQ